MGEDGESRAGPNARLEMVDDTGLWVDPEPPAKLTALVTTFAM
jgi:hypothetical protein